MTVGLNFLASVTAVGAGNHLVGLDSDLFVGDNEERAFEFMSRYYRQYRNAPDARTVQENTGVRLPTPRGDVAFHIDNLYERRTFDSIRDTYGSLREAIQSRQPGPALQVLEDGIRRARRTRRQNTIIDIRQGFDQVLERLDNVRGLGGISGVTTPWNTLNHLTAGYQPADLITYVGRMGTGKTMNLLYQAAAAYEEGYSVLFVTTEMHSESITRRWMAMRYHVDPHVLKSGMVSSALRGRMSAWRDELLGVERFRILPLGTGGSISEVERAVDEFNPDIIYVDGAYLLKPAHHKVNNRNELVAYIFDELKQLTIDTRKPWVVNTQFNRQAGAKGKDGSLETIGMADVIGQHSSIVIAVKPGITENPALSREMDILKGREGEHGKFHIHYRFKPTDLSEMTPEQVEAAEVGSAEEGEEGPSSGYQWR